MDKIHHLSKGSLWNFLEGFVLFYIVLQDEEWCLFFTSFMARDVFQAMITKHFLWSQVVNLGGDVCFYFQLHVF